MIEGTLTLMLL